MEKSEKVMELQKEIERLKSDQIKIEIEIDKYIDEIEKNDTIIQESAEEMLSIIEKVKSKTLNLDDDSFKEKCHYLKTKFKMAESKKREARENLNKAFFVRNEVDAKIVALRLRCENLEE